MIKRLFCLVYLPLVASCAAPPTNNTPPQAVAPAPPPTAPVLTQSFARGAYWGLDPNAVRLNAEKAGKDTPGFLDQLFRDLKETYHCNVLWSNSGGIPEHVQAMDIAAKYDLKIIGWADQYQFSAMDTEAKMEARVKQTTEVLKNKKACGGYVICEEVDPASIPQFEYYRQLAERFDPARPGIFVPAAGVTLFAYQTKFPVICSEAYLFGGPQIMCCPKTPESSRDYYIQMMNGLGDLARKSGKIAWVMPQALGAATGKTWLDDEGNMVIEAGSAWVNRMATPAEIRFQIWDAVRAGCKGVIFFYLMTYTPEWHPDKPNPTEAERKTAEAMDKALESLRTQTDITPLKARVNTGEPRFLLQLGGGGTRQSRTMGEAFAAIEKLEPLIVSWKRAAFPVVFAGPLVGVNTFESPLHPGRRFAVVVNHDTAAQRNVPLLFAPNVTGVTDLRTGTKLPLAVGVNNSSGLPSVSVTLAAGDGTVLEIAFADDRPGVLLFEDDFSHFNTPLLLENLERINLPFVSGVGDFWAVRKVRAPAAPGTAHATGLVLGRHEGPVPCARLRKLHQVGQPQGPLGGSLALKDRGLCEVLVGVEGTFPKAESLIIATINQDGQEAWLSSDTHYYPVRIPAKDSAGKEIVELRFILADDALLTNVRCWRVERAPAP